MPAELFNMSLKEYCFDCWKVLWVVPVFENVRSTAESYHPGILLSVAFFLVSSMILCFLDEL